MKATYADFTGLKLVGPSDGILEIVFDAPERLNAVSEVAHAELTEIWPVADADPEVKVIILRGEGANLSAGGDLAMVEAMADDWHTRMRVFKEARALVYNIANCSKPIVAAIEGVAVGAGLAAALVSDITIAGRSARIIDGHTKLGVAAGDHAVFVWPLLCGMAKAKYYLMTCDKLSGEEAERIGLVSLCVEDGNATAKAHEVARKLADGAQSAISLTKVALNNWLLAQGPSFDASLAMEFLGFDGPELAEGLSALKEKRRPRFA